MPAIRTELTVNQHHVYVAHLDVTESAPTKITDHLESQAAAAAIANGAKIGYCDIRLRSVHQHPSGTFYVIEHDRITAII